MPIKCPVAPLEFLFLADWFFHEQGIRDQVELTLATPLPGASPSPSPANSWATSWRRKNIKLVTEFNIEQVDPDAKTIVSYDEREVEYRPAGERSAQHGLRR